jgi:hypothetical protein
LTRNEEWSVPYNPWLLIAQGLKEYNSANTKVSETPKNISRAGCGLIRGSGENRYVVSQN